jgi:hypothetical protein
MKVKYVKPEAKDLGPAAPILGACVRNGQTDALDECSNGNYNTAEWCTNGNENYAGNCWNGNHHTLGT